MLSVLVVGTAVKPRVGCSPSDDVAVSVYPPFELPTSIFPYDGVDDNPVPPYNTPTDDVALTTPLFACSGPLSVPTVNPPFSVCNAENTFAVYVFGIVVDACMYELTAASVYDTLLLNVFQSVELSNPLTPLAAVGMFHVMVDPAPVIVKSVPVVLVANVTVELFDV